MKAARAYTIAVTVYNSWNWNSSPLPDYTIFMAISVYFPNAFVTEKDRFLYTQETHGLTIHDPGSMLLTFMKATGKQ